MVVKDRLTAAEALVGFCDFAASALDIDTATFFNLRDSFLIVNEISAPRDGWEKRMTIPEIDPEPVEVEADDTAGIVDEVEAVVVRFGAPDETNLEA